jgi:hypothetical protein
MVGAAIGKTIDDYIKGKIRLGSRGVPPKNFLKVPKLSES